MPSWSRIVLRGVTLSLIGYVTVAWCMEHEVGWLGWCGATSALALLLIFGVRPELRRLRSLRQHRWDRAIFDADTRPGVVTEVRTALDGLANRPANRAKRDALRLTLAELLDAEGDYGGAMAVVDAIALERLAPLQRALVVHTRAVIHLRASDEAGALRALELFGSCEEPELVQRVRLLRAYAESEQGDPEKALLVGREIELEPSVDVSVLQEVRVVRAAALDKLGKHQQALDALKRLDDDALHALAELGQPRVRMLARKLVYGAPAAQTGAGSREPDGV